MGSSQVLLKKAFLNTPTIATMQKNKKPESALNKALSGKTEIIC